MTMLHGRWRPRAVPSARDHLLQLATTTVLGPPMHRAVFDSAWAADHGLAQGEGRHSFERTARAGCRHQVPIDLATFYDAIPRSAIDGKLEAFFPNEPLAALVRQWLTGPILFQGQEIERVESLPPGTPLAPLLTRLLLPELDRPPLQPSMRLVRSGSRYVLAMRDLDAIRARAHEASAVMAPAFGSHQPNLPLRGLESSELGRRFLRVMQASESPRFLSATDGCAALGTAGRSRPPTRARLPDQRSASSQPSMRQTPRASIRAHALASPGRPPRCSIPIVSGTHCRYDR